ncbi:MAG TPA: dihydrofolate reductase family protein, partial [Arthrobacter sp.]|nr:dihydrofolate reductase family protein [Arthrobacter sp.]
SRILSAFLAAGLVDELIVYLAPTLLGSGTPALEDLGITTLADAQRWEWDPASGGAVQQLGRDLRLHLRPALTTSALTTSAPTNGALTNSAPTTSTPTTSALAPVPAATSTSADSTPFRTVADTAAGGN